MKATIRRRKSRSSTRSRERRHARGGEKGSHGASSIGWRGSGGRGQNTPCRGLPGLARDAAVAKRTKRSSISQDQGHSRRDIRAREGQDRILEYLAVRKLNRMSKGRSSVSRALRAWARLRWRGRCHVLGRKFVASRSEACGMRQIRGHRRTYIGALPGQIIQGLRRAESRNRYSSSTRSTSSARTSRRSASALEVLDSSRTTHPRSLFDVPFDLSEVRSSPCQRAASDSRHARSDGGARDPGYTEEEKLAISRATIWCKADHQSWLTRSRSPSRRGIRAVVHGYTRDAGVRNSSASLGGAVKPRAGGPKAPRRRGL